MLPKETSKERKKDIIDINVGVGNTAMISDDFITEGYYTEGMDITIDEPPELG